MVKYVDWLKKIEETGGALAWITRSKDFPEGDAQRTRRELFWHVLKSEHVKNEIRKKAYEKKQDLKIVENEAKDMLENMAHDFDLTTTKAVGFITLKIVKRIFSKIMINMEALPNIRRMGKQDAVIFVPTHRTYMDFLLISLICFDANIALPAICAGSDFQSSKLVGEILRKCGAFFIKRSFNNDNLYWAIFSEYVQHHIIKNVRPVEFFSEGQRSRVSKSLWPKLGLLRVATEPFYKNMVFDTIVVPVTINYDRLLEAFLYGRELLGIPKPKENMTGLRWSCFYYTYLGLLKARSVCNRNFGKVFVTFGSPISLRNVTQVDRTVVAFQPCKNFELGPNIKHEISRVAHDILAEHNQHNIVTIWPLMASVILSEIDQYGSCNLRYLLRQVNKLCRITQKLSVSIWLENTVEDDVNYYLSLYDDLCDMENDIIRLKAAEPETRTDLPVGVLERAIPTLVLSNCANPASYLFFNYAATLLLCTSNNRIAAPDLIDKFKTLRHIFSREFVHKPGSDTETLHDVLCTLLECNILSSLNGHLEITNIMSATLIINTIKPYINAYEYLLEKLITGVVSAKEAIRLGRGDTAKSNGEAPNVLRLSSEVIKNVYHLTTKASKEELHAMLEILRGLVQPMGDNVRSRL